MTETEWFIFKAVTIGTNVFAIGAESLLEVIIAGLPLLVIIEFSRWAGHKWEFRKSRKPDDKTYDGG